MLTPSQIADLKNKDLDLFNLFRIFQDALNQVGIQMGIDPKPAPQVLATEALPAPKAPSSIKVSVVNQIVWVLLGAATDAKLSVLYFVQKSSTPNFTADV